MKSLVPCLVALLFFASCSNTQNSEFKTQNSEFKNQNSPCATALIAYAEHYPAAEAQDLYKLVFQDLYGPGHLLADSAAAMRYLERELDQMEGREGPMPAYEYTLCDSHFVRIDLRVVKSGLLSPAQLVSAMFRSAEGLPSPEARFVLSHSQAFREAYKPHYRIVRRDIFEQEILPLFDF